MKSSENKKFENAWKHAFADAQAEPHQSVWANLDVKLSEVESGEMKRSVLFYQRLAAASILVAFLLGGVTILNWNDRAADLVLNKMPIESKNEGLNSNTKKPIDQLHDSSASNQDRVQHLSKSLSQHKNIANSINTIQKSNQYEANDVDKLHEIIQVTSTYANKLNVPAPEQKDDKTIFSSGHSLSIDLKIPTCTIRLKNQPVFTLTNSTTTQKFVEPILAQPKKKINDEVWWAAIGGSAGAYFPQGISSASVNYSTASVNQSNSTSSPTIGSSFSFGITVGKNVAPRWVLLAGVNYLTQTVGYTSNAALNGTQAFVADATNLKANTIISGTAAYSVNSVNEFVSVPVQAGYIITDRKIGLQLNAGVATDIFTKNSLIDPSGKLTTYTQFAGENSSYQQVNWTCLLSTELSYKVSPHYRVSLVPGIRYSFQSILKPSAGSTLHPFVWDVGFRFRYIF